MQMSTQSMRSQRFCTMPTNQVCCMLHTHSHKVVSASSDMIVGILCGVFQFNRICMVAATRRHWPLYFISIPVDNEVLNVEVFCSYR